MRMTIWQFSCARAHEQWKCVCACAHETQLVCHQVKQLCWCQQRALDPDPQLTSSHTQPAVAYYLRCEVAYCINTLTTIRQWNRTVRSGHPKPVHTCTDRLPGMFSKLSHRAE